MVGCPHNRQYECNACTEAAHAAKHPTVVDGCSFCKLGTIQLSQAIKPRRPNDAPPAGNRNNWERGVVTDGRGVPMLDATGERIGVKQYAENKHAFEAERRRLATHPDPFGATA